MHLTAFFHHASATRIVLFIVATPLTAADFFVGAGGAADGCTQTSIQSAVNAAASTSGPDTIHIARDQSYSNQAIDISGFPALPDDRVNLLVLGGLARCSSPPSSTLRP